MLDPTAPKTPLENLVVAVPIAILTRLRLEAVSTRTTIRSLVSSALDEFLPKISVTAHGGKRRRQPAPTLAAE